jgi:hypothetical protein
VWILLFLPLEDRKSAKAAALCRYRIAGGILGRTVPSFRLALAEEESEWREYRKYLDKSERKDFDEMFAIPRLYLAACSGSVKVARIFPIFMSIALHHYKELLQIAEQLELGEQTICH